MTGALSLGMMPVSAAIISAAADYPAIDLNFASGIYPPIATFSRPTLETAITLANGSPVLATFGNNAPAFPYDPVSHVALGTAWFGQATNLLLQSNQFDTTWISGQLALSKNAIGPDGITSAWSFVPAAGLSGSDIKQSVAVTSGNAQTFSVFLKNGNLSGARWVEVTAVSTSVWRVWFDLLNGVKGTSAGSPTSYDITPAGNGWYRVDITFTAGTTSAEIHFDARTANGSTVGLTGDGVNPAFNAFGAQLEPGTLPTPYIATTTAAATRNTDVGTVPLNVTNIPANPVGLTALVKVRTAQGVNSATNQYPFAFSDGTANNRIAMYRAGAAADMTALVTKGGVSQWNTAFYSGSPNNTDMTFWLAVAGSDFAAGAVGQAKITQASGALPTGLTTLHLGADAIGGQLWNSTIARLIIYNRRLPDAQAAAIAASL